MPEFVPVLVVAILLFMSLVVTFGGIFTGFDQPASHRYSGDYDEDIGEYMDESRTIELAKDVTLSSYSGDVFIANFSGVVKRGLISSKEEYSQFNLKDLPDVKGASIDFIIKDTNSYGPFYVYINNKAAFNYPVRKGNYTANIAKYALGSLNDITFEAGSSGWRFWAPTIYDYYAEVYADYTGEKEYMYEFTMSSSDMNNFKSARGEIVISSSEGAGQYVVRINGRELRRGTDDSFFIITKDKLFRGTNVVQLIAEPESRYVVDSLNIIIDWR